jgi:transcription-repair coupling factor (superfamily II helicase)
MSNIFSKMFNHNNNLNRDVLSFNNEVNAIYIATLLEQKMMDILVITNSLYEANKLYESISTYTDAVFLFPMDEFLTSEALAISPELKIKRIDTINNLLVTKPKIVITNLMGALRYLPPKSLWIKNIIEFKVGSELKKEDIVNKLYNIGYVKETLVSKTGEMATRGFIIDIFTINENNPIRIEFFGDYIESIRYFDIDNQKSLNEIETIKIYPVDEFVIEDNSEERKTQKYLPEYLKKVSSIKEYLNDPIIIYKDYNQIANSYKKLKEDIEEYHLSKDFSCKTNYMNDLDDIVSSHSVIKMMTIENVVSNYENRAVENIDVKKIINFNSNVDAIKKYIIDEVKNKKTIIIAVKNYSDVKRLKGYIDCELNITDENNIKKNKVNLIVKNIKNGFEYGDIILITEYELFNVNQKEVQFNNKFHYSSKIKDINKLHIGDYIVHNIYGIGMYEGIVTLTQMGIKKDYLKIKYAGKDKLYIPAEKIELISKYSGNEGAVPKINRLGSSDWKKTKIRVKTKIKDIANRLLLLSAERESKKGFAFMEDIEEQVLFENEFIYEETKDQLLAIDQIKLDMEKTRPMDRLLCGDVGYGKTEVAFRAMFKAILNNKQVAYLCPTTILSNQQYVSALERFKSFPINIRLLNRFTTKKDQKKILYDLKSGSVDVIFGTHRILSKDVFFKDLGLLIVDEEQRFGVLHKEQIKEYKANIDILTLSATPIPRTLQMSMVGLRELSLIETPPVNRYPIQTYVLSYNNKIIQEAVYKELSRDGQVFILYNRVDSIEKKVYEIKQLVPDAKITYAHGKMSKNQLEKIMADFINKEYNILICTTIIETGIDIPNANTLIIIDADKFGLSQLYQIRGRVGRSDKIAYAYLMYDDKKILNDVAVKRLQVIKEFTELGSGFSIAVRDLSIRGAGDILGSEQAGFIDSVGIDLYIKLLNEEVLKLKGFGIKESSLTVENDEKPLISVETHIDNNYVEEEELKIEIHKKINSIDSYDSLSLVKKELEDRFGKVPDKIVIYMYEEWFDKIAKKLDIKSVKETKNHIELVFSKKNSSKIDGEKLFMEAYNLSNRFRFSYKDDRFTIFLDTFKLEEHWLFLIMKLLEKMEEFINV